MEEARAEKNNREVIDRLSTLPDSLLLHILSFLPTKTCVKTMSFVSHRYLNLWEHLQVFDFHNEFHKYIDYQPENFRSFSLFVNSVLARRRFRDIQILRLSCGFSRLDQFSTPSLYMWVGTVIWPHLKELHLSLLRNQGCLFSFSLSIFTSCRNLVFLSLSGDISPKSCSTVCLPLLETLIIDLDYVDVPLVDNLLSSCPILKILEVSIFPKSLTTLRLPHSLKRLKFTSENAVGTCLEIDAPDLKHLSLTRITIEGSTIANLHKVDEARLDVFCSTSESISVYPLHNLLRALSGIKRLVLGGLTTKGLLEAEFPEFRHVIHLELILPCFNNNFLYQVLQKCPMLQALIIQKHKNPLKQPYRWTPKPIDVPYCLRYHLTFIHFKGFQGSIDELKFTEYVLEKGLVLKTMQFSSLLMYRKEKREERHYILRKFSDTPRGSSICQLKFD